MKNSRLPFFSCLFLLFTIFLSACNAVTPTVIPTNTSAPVGPYPTTGNEPTQDPSIRPFRLDKPILPGATEVTGSGTPGVPVLLLDITTMGTYVGDAVIQDDGTFTMQVAALEKDHRLGLALNDLEGTQWKSSDFENPAYFGENARLVPQITFFYDTAPVREK